ncbi:MAG: hypothetical protein A2157_19855 [Deltaproteobacteria bacterium RBG_16_47_11]|nr:MAG: hypothetical protein A2157_19855 [Deltaproteobacteria bacterium RBG_16_47_11]
MDKTESRLKSKQKDEEEIIEEQSIKTTRALIQTFLQTMKAFRLYEPNHPILVKFLDRLKKDFDHYFEEFGSFPLVVGEHRLFYRGNVVYESQDVKESLAFFFFKDGIRDIKFIKGLEFREVVDFLHVMRKSESVNRLEDDLVTLLWEKDFSHITFGTVDEFLEGESHFVPATEEDFIQRLEFKGYGEGSPEEMAPEKEEPSFVALEGLKQALNPSPGQSLVEACMLTPDEIEEVNREVEQEYQPDYIYTLVDNLVEILLHLGEDLDAYENMISYFEKTVGSFLEQKEVRKAAIVLKKLNDTMESMVLKDKQIFAIRRILETFSGSHSIQRLGEAMKGNGEADSEAILHYLRLLTKKAVEPLCLLLGELESGKWRKVVCDTLADLSQQEIQPLIKFLSDPNPFLVCHIIYVLGRVGHPSALKYMGHLVIHQDQKVREETLQVIKRFGEMGKDLVEKFLKDPTPALRAKASHIFAKMAGEDAVHALTGIILSEDFMKRDYEEKASFFKALGETGSQEVIPFLKKIEQTRKWFQKTKWNEMRQCARNTLKMMRTVKEVDPSRTKPRSSPIEQSIHG